MLFRTRNALRIITDNYRSKIKTERKHSRRYRQFVWILYKDVRRSEKASLCPHRFRLNRGSFVVETALVLPIFVIGMIGMLSLLDYSSLEVQNLMELSTEAKLEGLRLAKENGTNEIIVEKDWNYTPIKEVLPIPEIHRHYQIRVHSWNGTDPTDWTDSGILNEAMVIVTMHGSVYHTDESCRHLRVEVQTAPGTEVEHMRNESGERYYPCEHCSYRQSPDSMVYLTSSGNRYHNEASCGSLLRTNCLIPLTETEGMRECLTCQRSQRKGES